MFKAWFNKLKQFFKPKPIVVDPPVNPVVPPIVPATHKTGEQWITEAFYKAGHTNKEWLAYILATAWHETGKTMEPVTEWGTKKYLMSKPYWPYVGRGYVQLTWKENYKKYGIENDPEKAKDPEFAAHIIVDGMVKGIFTGRKLEHYFNATKEDPVNARKIINGLDKAQLIASYYRMFKERLNDPGSLS